MASPVVQNQWPADGATLVAPRQPAYLEITDADADLVAASVILKHNGLVAWSGDAEQPGFAVTKTAITNGFSYSILPDVLPDKGGKVQIDVYAEDGIPNSVAEVYDYTLGVREYLVRRDDFDDSSLDPALVIPAGNGIVTEPAGTELKLDCPNSLQCHWWTSVANAPRPYFPIPSWFLENAEGVFQVESKLTQYDESVNGLSYGGGPFILIDDQNMIEVGYYTHTSYRDVRVHRGVANTFSLRAETGALSHPNTTAHRYRIIWNDSGRAFRLDDGSVLEDGDITFYYSVNDGASWARLYTEAMALDSNSLVGFGAMLRKDPAGAGDNAQAYIDYLELRELVPLTESVPPDGGQIEDEAAPVGMGGPPNYQDGISRGQLVPGPPAQQVGSLGPFDDAQPEADAEVLGRGGPAYSSEVPGDVYLPAQALGPDPIGVLQDEVSYILGGLTDYRQTTNDFNGHPHFIGERVMLGFVYDAAAEAGPWTTPTDPSFTGYGKDGNYYINGVDQGTNAPWADESESDNRGPRADFPNRALICYTANGIGETPREVVIFDLDSFPTTLNVWMRFEFGPSGGNYTMMGRINQHVTDVAMANGILSVVTTEGDYRGALHMINFTQPGKDCGHYIRSNNHYVWQPATEIAGRNLTGASQWSGTGVTIGLLTDEEQIHSVAMFAEGADTWVAIAGEDPGPNLYRLAAYPEVRVQVTGDVGEANSGNVRRVSFDEDGHWWFALENRLHRILAADYKEGYAFLDISVPNRRRGAADEWVELPWDINDFVAVGDYLFVATEVGVYRIDRGSMEWALAYTIVGGGGGGTTDTPPAGELIPGLYPEVTAITGHALHSAHYLHVATFGAVATIRTLDDLAVDSRLFPDLHEPYAHFNVALVK